MDITNDQVLHLLMSISFQMVAQFGDTCIGCNPNSQKQKELERFVQRYMSLDSDEVAVALMVTSREMLDLLSPLVPCVGCRNGSVARSSAYR